MEEQKKKNILFISALDFKEKSIQVIRKTPEAYAKAGWNVHYIVARNNEKRGNYFYEREINLQNINIYRIYWPLTGMADLFRGIRYLSLIIGRLREYLTILKLFYIGKRFLNKHKVDIVYGYETHGVLVVKLLKKVGALEDVKIVSRFQGSFIAEMLANKEYLRLLWNHSAIVALKLPADLIIMTNDGTNGDKALNLINPENTKKMLFWTNGCDNFYLNEPENIRTKYNIHKEFILLTVCRLVEWKRVDRGINIIYKLVKDFGIHNIKYFIVGDGNERRTLEEMALKLNVADKIVFCGAILNHQLGEYYNLADVVILTYEHSNVGNPLFESIRANKYIFTLNNGDTNSWIKHEKNGFIYNIDDMLIDNMSKDICEIISNPKKWEFIKENLLKTEEEKLWTWEERMDAEVEAVKMLINQREG